MNEQGYGLSETGSVCNQIGETYKDVESQHGSTGPPLYGVELKIVGPDNSTLLTDQEGEVLIRYEKLAQELRNH